MNELRLNVSKRTAHQFHVNTIVGFLTMVFICIKKGDLMTTIDMLEYEYESDDGSINMVFKCFPHMISNQEVIKRINKAFRVDMTKRIKEDFYNDAFLALTYTLGTELFKMSPMITGEGNAATIMTGIQNHISKDIKAKGIFLSSATFVVATREGIKEIHMTHDGLKY